MDVESTSEGDLKVLGAEAYWAHPSTILICVYYRIDDGPIIKWLPGDGIPYFVPELSQGGWRIVAHNFLFELNCWVKHLGPKHGWLIPRLHVWDCTMARALYWGLPAGLIDVCAALNLSVQIDPAKKARIKRMSRPRGYDKATLAPVWWHETDPDRLAELLEDCENDVRAECALDDALPALPPREREIFLIDAEINQRGIMIDLPLVDKLEALTKSEGVRLNADMSRLTNGRATTCNQGARIIAELADASIVVPDLTKNTVATALTEVMGLLKQWGPGTALACERVRDILLTRQEAAKASTAKLSAMRKGVSPDGRARGLFQYCGAGRTHRWAARRIQPQNMPRGTIKNLASLFRLITKCQITAAELAPLIPGTVMDAISSMLRGCLIASAGYLLVSADLSQIEARLTLWYAGQTDILAIFAAGEDVYTFTARQVGSDNRQLGKVLVLACGFGMGAEKFQATAAAAPYFLNLTLEEAEEYVRRWRELNSKVVSFWWDCDRAFRHIAVSPHGTSETVGRVAFRKTGKAVRIVLPSGSELVYHNVELRPRADGSGRDEITFMGVDPKTKKWSQQRTYGGKIVENIVQATDRDVLSEAMINIKNAQRATGHNMPRAHVLRLHLLGNMHDELLGEAPEHLAQDALDFLLRIMRTPPAWAPGLPTAAEGWVGRRYKK
jgi:DNA polymerase